MRLPNEIIEKIQDRYSRKSLVDFSCCNSILCWYLMYYKSITFKSHINTIILLLKLIKISKDLYNTGLKLREEKT